MCIKVGKNQQSAMPSEADSIIITESEGQHLFKVSLWSDIQHSEHHSTGTRLKLHLIISWRQIKL